MKGPINSKTLLLRLTPLNAATPNNTNINSNIMNMTMTILTFCPILLSNLTASLKLYNY